MSISSVSGASAAQWQRSAAASTQSKNNTAQAAAAGSSTAAPGSSTAPTSLGFNASAGIEVSLPNGISVGVFSISPGANPFAQGAGASGGSGNSALAQMIASVEQMAAALENYTVPGSSTAGQSSATNGSSAAADAANAAGPGASIQGMTASMPNGISVEVFDAEQGSGTSGSNDGSSNAMASTIEQLVADLDKYPAAAGAYAKAGANPTAAAAAGVNAVA
jgi:hypothetical protein